MLFFDDLLTPHYSIPVHLLQTQWMCFPVHYGQVVYPKYQIMGVAVSKNYDYLCCSQHYNVRLNIARNETNFVIQILHYLTEVVAPSIYIETSKPPNADKLMDYVYGNLGVQMEELNNMNKLHQLSHLISDHMYTAVSPQSTIV